MVLLTENTVIFVSLFLSGIMLVTIHGVHGYTLVGDDIGMGIVTEYVQWLADKPAET